MTDKATPPLSVSEVEIMARAAGLPVDEATAKRIATSIGPALEGFSPIAGTLPFDLEPASFTRVQNGGRP
ncbi:hypothetical protein [Bradyrhizobium sp. WD16]|uniref:hypothetical protein n=1 Tax=Bradyrhizobium sp. WD16 TaxID=1521768 RepID=UPI0020A58C54|nr:hypothetical protein [Bradyrhizobium sp. WD16]UTD25973.1 hypothetical protein DB459_02570 [Bradyrhizobium sp. WD16]